MISTLPKCLFITHPKSPEQLLLTFLETLLRFRPLSNTAQLRASSNLWRQDRVNDRHNRIGAQAPRRNAAETSLVHLQSCSLKIKDATQHSTFLRPHPRTMFKYWATSAWLLFVGWQVGDKLGLQKECCKDLRKSCCERLFMVTCFQRPFV